MGVYTFFSQGTAASLSDDSSAYTMGIQFTVSEDATLTGIWWNSPAGAGVLPSACAIFEMTSPGNGSIVAGTENNSPSWSGAQGSGWVKCTYSGSVTLSPGNTYKAAVQLPGGDSQQYGATTNYWTSGPGASGLTSGPLSAPNNAGGDGGQDTYNTGGSLTYPDTSFDAANYWVDVEVTTSSAPPATGQVLTAETITGIGSSSPTLICTTLPGTAAVTLQNQGSDVVTIGGPAVTAGEGIELPVAPSAPVTIPLKPGAPTEVYGITATGSSSVAWLYGS